MADLNEIEERLSAVERAVKDLQERLARSDSGHDWLTRIRGAFNDCPDFDEVVRLGREFRESQPIE